MKKTRYLDHVDLRVSDLKSAHKFYGKLLPALGFICDRSSGRWGIFYAAGGDKPEAFFGFTQDRRHQPNGTRLAFWAETREEVNRLARLVRKIGGRRRWKARRSVPPTVAGIMLAFSKIQTETNSRFVAGKVRLFRVRPPASAWRCLPRDQTP